MRYRFFTWLSGVLEVWSYKSAHRAAKHWKPSTIRFVYPYYDMTAKINVLESDLSHFTAVLSDAQFTDETPVDWLEDA